MSRRAWFQLCLFVLALTILGVLWIQASRRTDLVPVERLEPETIVLGQDRFVPGSRAGLRVMVRDSQNASPWPDAEVRVALQPQDGGEESILFSGVTDELGNVDVSFAVPAELAGQQTLVVETTGLTTTERIEYPVTLARDYRLLLTTDKPLYQPGQIIHLRALALSTFDLRPAAGEPVDIVVSDAKGNKVFRKTLETSDFGIVSTDFELASQVNTGRYNISATMGSTSSEKTVTVEHYVLPKFDVRFVTERSYYRPGQKVAGTLRVAYFFGKPVSEAEILLEGYTFDVAKEMAVSLQGSTDENGVF